MGRPRVVIASADAERTVAMVEALNPKRYRVEQLRDQSEALLHAELVLAHALVLHIEHAGELQVRRCEEVALRLTPVFVSPDESLREMALTLGGRFVLDPFAISDFKRSVYRAVSRTHAQRMGTRRRLRDSRPREVRHVLVLTSDPERANLMAAVLNANIDAKCRAASSLSALIDSNHEPLDCVVAETELLLDHEHSRELLRTFARDGVQLVPLTANATDESTDAAQVAWDVAPAIRRALAARARPRPSRAQDQGATG